MENRLKLSNERVKLFYAKNTCYMLTGILLELAPLISEININ